MLKRIHVNQHRIRSNIGKLEPDRAPPIGVETSQGKLYGNHIQVLDKDGSVVLEFIYRPDKPLKCGARLWAETELEIKIL